MNLKFYLVRSNRVCNTASGTRHRSGGHPVCMSSVGEGADIDFQQIQISLSYTHAHNKRITYDELCARYKTYTFMGGKTKRRGNRVFGRAQPYSVRVLYIVYVCARARGVGTTTTVIAVYYARRLDPLCVHA